LPLRRYGEHRRASFALYAAPLWPPRRRVSMDFMSLREVNVEQIISIDILYVDRALNHHPERS